MDGWWREGGGGGGRRMRGKNRTESGERREERGKEGGVREGRKDRQKQAETGSNRHESVSISRRMKGIPHLGASR